MKALTVLLLSLLLSPITMIAQEAEMKRGGEKMEQLEEQLDLTDEQTEQIKELKKKQREEMKTVRGKYKEEMAKILTPEQLQKLEELKKEEVNKKIAEATERQIERMKSVITLTADQEAKIREILTASNTEAADVKMNDSLTDEERKEKLKAIKKASKEKINAVLTPEQVKQIKEARQKSKKK